MPTYEYTCKKCGERFDVKRSFFEKEQKEKCPKCGTESTERVFSVFGQGTSDGSRQPPRFT